MNPSDVEIQRLQRPESGAWDGYVRAHPGGTPYHLAAVIEMVRSVFGHDVHCHVARDAAGTVRGVLPLVRLRSLLFGDYMVSMPFFNYGGPLADDPAIDAALMADAADHGRALGVSHIEVRGIDAREVDWPVRDDKVVMELALPDDEDALFKSFGSKLRAQIRRPTKAGATARVGGAELLGDFYRVFAHNMRDLGTPVYGRGFFQAMHDTLPGAVRLVVVHLDGEPVAAGLLLADRDRVEIPWASSLRAYNRQSVNMLLYWESLRHAVASGARCFDFGRSTEGGGTFRFKQQWGAEPRRLHWYYWMRAGGDPPRMNPDNPKYRLAIRAWQRLPLAVANALGPRIVRNLP